MKTRFIMGALVAFCATACVTAVQSAPKTKAIKDQLIGTWQLVSNSDKNSDGSPKWGENPKGNMIFDASGRYSFIIVRSDLPQFAANAMDKGTAEENARVVQGSFANFGTYTVDENKRTFATKVEGSIYPNLTGRSIVRLITFIGSDELRYTNAATATGASAEAMWRRVKPSRQ
jgi:lipocalin-like protein